MLFLQRARVVSAREDSSYYSYDASCRCHTWYKRPHDDTEQAKNDQDNENYSGSQQYRHAYGKSDEPTYAVTDGGLYFAVQASS